LIKAITWKLLLEVKKLLPLDSSYGANRKVAIAKVLIRSKQRLAALRIKDRVLVMETIFYPDEIRSPASL
jgi:DNA end-binding protein Ku